MKRIVFASLLIGTTLLLSCSGPDRNRVKIIPRPSSYWVEINEFVITPETRILTQTNKEAVLEVAQYLPEKINTSSGIPLEIADIDEVKSISKDIIISTHNADTAWGKESYRLDVEAGRVIIHAYRAAGLFYGVQSLLQLLPLHSYSGAAHQYHLHGQAQLPSVPR